MRGETNKFGSWLTEGDEWTDGDASGVSYAGDFFGAACDQLGLSHTGFESEVFDSVASYLVHISTEVDGERQLLLGSEKHPRFREWCVAAELAAKADFTDYGVSMRTAWVSDAGKAWLASYREWLKESEHG